MAGTNVTNQPEVERVVLVFTILYGRILQISISECPPPTSLSKAKGDSMTQPNTDAGQDAAGKCAPAGVGDVNGMFSS